MTEQEIYIEAMDRQDLVERQRFLDDACVGDQSLRDRVENLIRQSDQLGSFLDHPPVEAVVAEAGVGGDSCGDLNPTIQHLNGSTVDDDPGATTFYSSGTAPMTKPQDDAEFETALGYLEPSTKPDSLGRMGHYEVLEVIGRGAFGTVLRAFDEKLQRVVAIKVMAPELAATSPARKRFLREAQASAAIRHEHVVSVYAVEEKPLPYLVMEFIPGQTLQQRLDQAGPLDVPTVLWIGRQMAEGLAAAHAQDLIHRDIKPANILLETGARDMVKVTDFGLARAADDASLTQSGTIAGTPMYMAPEQAAGQKLDQRADLFSFGSVLYQMVSGRPPFRATTTLAVLKRLAEDTPRPIREIIPETPQWLCDIITKLHAKNPDQRYQSAREIADVLANCETQLKEHSGLKDFSLIPRAKRQTAPSGKLVAAVLLVPLLVLSLTEITGVTNLIRRRPAETVTNDPGIKTETNVINGASVPQTDSAWVPLFNGKDLTGWKTTDELPGEWSVKDGILTGSSQQSYLFSERADFANFHLRVEAKTNGLGGSGLHFRAPFVLRHGAKAVFTQPASGYEVDLFNRPAPIGTILEIVKGAPPRAMCLAANNSAYRDGEWFTLELIADGNRFVTKINGQETVNSQDAASRYSAGHLAISVFDPRTVVQFRKIEIKELPSPPASVVGPQPRFFASNEWIDVIPLIDPQLDKWDMRLTGKNEWRIEQGELVGGGADDKPHKLLLPLDADFFPSFECELEFTRRAGETGFALNVPTANGDTPMVFQNLNQPGVFVRHRQKGAIPLSDAPLSETGKRTNVRVEVRRQQVGDRITVWNGDTSLGTWTGNRSELFSINNEGYEHRRRLSLWINAGVEFVFHRIRVRMLDGGNAETVRPVLAAPQPKLASTFTNTLGMEFVIVPKGKSWLGGDKDKLGDKEVEIPADFYLGKYEVTQEEWTQVMGENPSHFSRTGGGKDAVADVPDADLQRFPVENVSWDESRLFVEKLNTLAKETGWVYRLPKQTEWEYACRGGPMADKSESAFDFYFAKPTNNPLRDQTLAGINKGPNRTIKVGSTEANRLGLFDMHRNVWEWCDDTNEAAKESGHRVHVGGGWNNIRSHSAAANIETDVPSHRSNNLGLRLARVPSGAPSP